MSSTLQGSSLVDISSNQNHMAQNSQSLNMQQMQNVVWYGYPCKYNSKDLDLAVGMDTNKGRLLHRGEEIWGNIACTFHCYNLKKEILGYAHEITEIPQLDEVKKSKLYRLANPPDDYSTSESLTTNNVGVNTIINYVP